MIWGPTPLSAGRIRFALWAPGARSVMLEIAGRPPVPMQAEPDGWFAADAAAGPGTRYRFRPDGGHAVPNPASRAQAGDVHGWSLVVDRDHAWQHPDWQGRPWAEAVICEVHVGAMGGYAGVAAELPRLAALGITAIELMPLADVSGSRNWGYDGVLPYAPAAGLGPPSALKTLIDAAHGHGLMVYLDVVYNHFGPDGNYLPGYAPAFFRQDAHTPWGGAIDFGREPVARFFLDNARMWLKEYRFDGLRFDAVHAIADGAFLDRLAAETRAVIGPGRHVHLMLENEANDAHPLERGYDAQWNDDFHNVLHVLLTGEDHAYYRDFADRPAERLARCLAEGFVYQGEGSPNHDGRPRGTPSGHLPPTAFIGFLQNHDQIGNRALGERLTRLVAPDRLRAATGLLLLAPHIPLLIMGDECGSRSPFLFFTDFHDALADAVRTGRRAEFAASPGFADAGQRARIPDPNDPATFTASQPLPGPDAAAWSSLYRDLLALRRSHVQPGLAACRALGAAAIGPAAVMARWQLGAHVLLIAINLGPDPAPFVPPPADPLVLLGLPIVDTLPPATFAAWILP